MKKQIIPTLILAIIFLLPQLIFAQSETKKNVLFIIVDDLRPDLGCYGNNLVKTPNIDKLAGEGTVFTNAFANYPVCGPSRASFLSGLRPNNTRYTSNECSVEADANGAIDMPSFFKENGYITSGMGKVYHHTKDRVEGWSDGHWHPTMDEKKSEHPDTWRDYQNKENIELCYKNKGKANSYEIGEVGDFDYFDGKLAKRAIAKMTKFKTGKKPFFITVGFVKPHLPFNAPKKYFDMYPLEDIQLPANFQAPENVPEQAMHNWWELRAYTDIPKKQDPMPEQKAKELIRAYRACVAYTDAMVGEVLNSLEEQGLADNTIVVLIGDHGWSLGEHSLWVKHSNFNKALNTTCIIKAPGMKGGQKSNSLVELVDIYPTLVNLADLKAPKHLEGLSLVPILKKPNTDLREVAFSKMTNGWTASTKEYSYTEWYNKNGEVEGSMLYDRVSDNEENKNLANISGNEKTIAKMKKLLSTYVDI